MKVKNQGNQSDHETQSYSTTTLHITPNEQFNENLITNISIDEGPKSENNTKAIEQLKNFHIDSPLTISKTRSNSRPNFQQ